MDSEEYHAFHLQEQEVLMQEGLKLELCSITIE